MLNLHILVLAAVGSLAASGILLVLRSLRGLVWRAVGCFTGGTRPGLSRLDLWFRVARILRECAGSNRKRSNERQMFEGHIFLLGCYSARMRTSRYALSSRSAI